MDRLQSAAGQLEDQIGKVRDQAREGLVRGREALLSLEHSVMRNVRRNPSLYTLAGMVLLGLLVARVLHERRERHQHEW